MSTPVSVGGLQNRLMAGLAELPLACFGVVMATGIISISAHLLALPRIARTLFHLNLLLYATLWLLTILRAARWPMRIVGDLMDHLRAPGAFTMVAGTSVVGSQFALLYTRHPGGFMLWFAALILWLILTYAIFALLTLKQDKPPLESGINGSWLLAVVATQSIVCLGALLTPDAPAVWQGKLLFLILVMWLSSGMLYIWIMGLIIYRYLFFRLDAAELSPSYWINMGAMAISTLAGCLLIANAGNSLFPHTMLPFIDGLTLFYWATGTWWIPMLLLLGIWRYGFRRYPLRYVAAYWSAVFPLGMYAACTEQLASVMHFEFLLPLARIFLYLALFAWTLTSIGLLHYLWQRLGSTARHEKHA